MTEKTVQENQAVIAFWDKAFALSEEDQAHECESSEEDWKELAPSEKLFQAACSLGQRKKVLDYGCGSAWATIIAAKSGCPDVTAVDAAPAAVKAARLYAARYGVAERIHFECAASGWLQGIPSESYDGLFCSNVLDVVPPETAEEIIRESARIIQKNGIVIIGMNYYLSPEAAAQRGMKLEDGNRLYVDGVLRLVSRTDEEWTKAFTPWYTIERLEHFAWPGEAKESRRLFWLRRREDISLL
jgi:SAM-dependent methyltransferase